MKETKEKKNKRIEKLIKYNGTLDKFAINKKNNNTPITIEDKFVIIVKLAQSFALGSNFLRHSLVWLNIFLTILSKFTILLIICCRLGKKFIHYTLLIP